MSPNVVGFVFARGGSKGLPGKNLKPLAGKPLVAHAVETARRAKSIDRVVISTDDPQIAEAAQAAGAEVPFLRPAELARDDSPEWQAWQHALEAVDAQGNTPVDVFVSIPPTAPLRTSEDIDACVARYDQGDADVVLCVTPAARHPSFNMVRLDSAGHAQLIMPTDNGLHHRQDASKVFDIATVCYVVRPAFLRAATNLFEGRVATVPVPRERAIDIDDALDFKIAEALIGGQG